MLFAASYAYADIAAAPLFLLMLLTLLTPPFRRYDAAIAMFSACRHTPPACFDMALRRRHTLRAMLILRRLLSAARCVVCCCYASDTPLLLVDVHYTIQRYLHGRDAIAARLLIDACFRYATRC